MEPLSVEEAQLRHAGAMSYCVVVIRDSGGYEAFIEISSDYFGVHFLDDRTRVNLIYGFEEAEKGRLFLDQVNCIDFVGEAIEPASVTTYYFKKGGAVFIERICAPSKRPQVTEETRNVDSNWQARPDFGEYGALLTKERPVW
jgi:hypothetical protein